MIRQTDRQSDRHTERDGEKVTGEELENDI